VTQIKKRININSFFRGGWAAGWGCFGNPRPHPVHRFVSPLSRSFDLSCSRPRSRTFRSLRSCFFFFFFPVSLPSALRIFPAFLFLFSLISRLSISLRVKKSAMNLLKAKRGGIGCLESIGKTRGHENDRNRIASNARHLLLNV
jgi:hypothetical protein